MTNTTGPNLIVNGGFEDNTLDNSGATWGGLNSGWVNIGSQDANILEQDYGHGNATGDAVAELESGVILCQEVDVPEGGKFVLSFDVSRRGTSDQDNKFELYIDGVKYETYIAQGQETVEITLDLTAGTHRFDFKSLSHTYIGAGLDDVSLHKVVEEPAVIAGRYFDDENCDGLEGIDEAGFDDKLIRLRDADTGEVVAETRTDANGNYRFEDVEPGRYCVIFEPIDGYDPTALDVGDDFRIDSDLKSNGESVVFHIGAGQEFVDVDAGLKDVTGTVAGRYFNDENCDGLEGQDEAGFGDKLIRLRDVDTGAIVAETRTDADGNYRFEGVTPGDYCVIFDPIDGFNPTALDVGDDFRIDSDLKSNGESVTFHIGAGEERLHVDAGLKQLKGTISGTVFCDVDCDGTNGSQTVVAGLDYTIEAEDMHKYNYETVHGSQASGGALARLKHAGSDGDLWTDFTGKTGVYDVTIRIQDEDDGQSEVYFKVGGELVKLIELDGDGDGGGSNNGGFSDFVINDVAIENGEEIKLWVGGDDGEFVRVDNIVLEGQDTVESETRTVTTEVAHEDFTGGADAGWSDRWTMDDNSGNTYLGGFGATHQAVDTEKTFDLPADTDKVTVEFDFLEVDSWDGETFKVFINGHKVELGSFFVDSNYGAHGNEDRSGTDGNVSWTVTSSQKGHLAGNAHWEDEIHKVTLTVENPGDDLKIGFGSHLNQDKNDESWGIDNLKITAEVQEVVTEPGKADVVVNLLDENGNAVLDDDGNAITTVTDADGNYSFEDVPVGDYQVQFIAPDGTIFTSQDVGTDDSIDSDVDGNGNSGTITVTDGGTTDIDAGLKDDPIVLVDDAIEVFESEGEGDLEDIEGTTTQSILANDTDATAVTAVNGVEANVGEWVDLFAADGTTPKGRVMINADGTVDFDANGDFDALDTGETDTVTVDYSFQPDPTLISVPKHNILFVVDISLSVDASFDGSAVGDVNGDGITDSILDAQIASYQALAAQIAASGLTDDDVDIGLVVFSGGQDVNDQSGSSRLIGTFKPGDAALDAALTGLVVDQVPLGATNFETPLQSSTEWFASQNATTADNNIVYFLSDGEQNRGGEFDDEAAVLETMFGAELNAVGVGNGAVLDELNVIDNTGGAEIVTTTDALMAALMDTVKVIEAPVRTATVEITVNGEANNGSIEGRSFCDIDGDAVDSAGDTAIVQQLVILLNSDGTAVLDGFGDPIIAFTQNDGSYSFPTVPVGDYRVGFEVLGGKDFVAQGEDADNDGRSDDTAASDVDDAAAPISVSLGAVSIDVRTTDVFTVSSGEVVADVDAGLFIPNAAPIAIDDAFTVPEDGLVFGSLLGNDSDPDASDVLTILNANGVAVNTAFTLTSAEGREGTAIVSADGALNFAFDTTGNFSDLNDGETDTITLSYTITDGNGLTGSADITVTVEGSGQPTALVSGNILNTGPGDRHLAVILDASDNAVSVADAFSIGDLDGDGNDGTAMDQMLGKISDLALTLESTDLITLIPSGLSGVPHAPVVVTFTAGDLQAAVATDLSAGNNLAQQALFSAIVATYDPFDFTLDLEQSFDAAADVFASSVGFEQNKVITMVASQLTFEGQGGEVFIFGDNVAGAFSDLTTGPANADVDVLIISPDQFFTAPDLSSIDSDTVVDTDNSGTFGLDTFIDTAPTTTSAANVVSFEISVDGVTQPDFDVSDLTSGADGFDFAATEVLQGEIDVIIGLDTDADGTADLTRALSEDLSAAERTLAQGDVFDFTLDAFLSDQLV